MRLAVYLVAAALSLQLAPIGLLTAATGESLANRARTVTSFILCAGANLCSPNPCRNQGVCREQPSGHNCNCTAGFFGTNCEDGLQLVGGSSPNEGRVEVFHEGTWESVCQAGWDLEDADVVCRQLGYGRAADISQSETFGQVSGDFGLGDVACTGSEATISDCSPSEWHRLDCDLEYAGVTCETNLAPSPAPDVSDFRREWLWLVVGFLLLGLAVAVIAFTVAQRLRKAKVKKAANRRRAMEMSRRPLPPVPPVPPRATTRNTRRENTGGGGEEREYDVPPDSATAGYDVSPTHTRPAYDVPPNYTSTPRTYDTRLPAPTAPPDPVFVGTYGMPVPAYSQAPSCYPPYRTEQPALPPRTFDTYGIHDMAPSDIVVSDTYCIDSITDRTSYFSRT
ncbi:PREDICTED: soluble scavenger receptor cysteine-rich domain-containing protein SSC5D-like [Branchiostoma belcheri]|uniref:Soluble scavenger receptor cysteine-rich domain-containing protein SSC5D-like n=1 Tax=Branchiostoma belcheri TaxID=7741 RepID=A0A6P4ZHL0_BRABE|nr:PREDICTED: soluble scavenger receptor cysteine-rich domain-containing protein SSC5D-like [Branchiostoma belcheri]